MNLRLPGVNPGFPLLALLFSAKALLANVEFDLYGETSIFYFKGGSPIQADFIPLGKDHGIRYEGPYQSYWFASAKDRLWGWDDKVTTPVYSASFAQYRWSDGGGWSPLDGNGYVYPSTTDVAFIPRKKIQLREGATELVIDYDLERSLTVPVDTWVSSTSSGFRSDSFCGVSTANQNGPTSMGAPITKYWSSQPFSPVPASGQFNVLGDPAKGLVYALFAPRILLLEGSSYDAASWSWFEPRLGSVDYLKLLSDYKYSRLKGVDPGGSTFFMHTYSGQSVVFSRNSEFKAPYTKVSRKVKVAIPPSMRGKTVYLVFVPFLAYSRIAEHTEGSGFNSRIYFGDASYFLRTSGTVSITDDLPKKLEGTLTELGSFVDGYKGKIEVPYTVQKSKAP